MDAPSNERQDPGGLKPTCEPLDDLDSGEFPCLSELLQGPAGLALGGELAKLMARRPRALRRTVELLGRLDAPGFQQTVRIRDVSATGTRLRMARRGCLDLMSADVMRLRCRVLCDDESNCSDLDVLLSVVRVVDMSDDYVELGFRFARVDQVQRNILGAMERLYFFQ